MSQPDELLPPLVVTDQQQIGDFLTGTLDVLIGLGVALANAGLVKRDEIAAAMERVIGQQKRESLTGVQSDARAFPALAMQAFFSRPLMAGGRGAAGLVAIDGGKASDPSKGEE